MALSVAAGKMLQYNKTLYCDIFPATRLSIEHSETGPLPFSFYAWTAGRQLNRPNEYWIGLKDTENEGAWKWDDGSGRDLQDNKDWYWWMDSEPNNAPKHKDIEEDCASAGWGYRSWGYSPFGVSDVNCETEKKTVLCVKRHSGKCRISNKSHHL